MSVKDLHKHTRSAQGTSGKLRGHSPCPGPGSLGSARPSHRRSRGRKHSRPALVSTRGAAAAAPGVTRTGSEQRPELLSQRSPESSAAPNTAQPHLNHLIYSPMWKPLGVVGSSTAGAQHSQKVFMALRRFTPHL